MNRLAISFVVAVLSISAAGRAQSPAAAEYARHLQPLADLTVAVARAMPPDKYTFKPHPVSMNFGELMMHIAGTNYAFCAGLKDAGVPTIPSLTDKDSIVKAVDDSFQYCANVIDHLTPAQLNAAHDSPDGHMPGRDILLAMYVHVAHHRGQAEIYLRDNGIAPPRYRI